MTGGGSLYAYHKVYPRSVQGRFRRIKWVVDAVLLSLFALTPWLRWDRGPDTPDQAILLDMAGRRGYVFTIEIWPQEVYYLTGLLMLAAIGLFLATSLFGRIWCGFTCIQTVFTDIFLGIEGLLEGDRARRQKRDQGPWTLARIGRTAVKNGLWLLVSVATSASWILYFNDAPTTTIALLNGTATPGLYGFLALFTASTFLLAGYAREQVCIYMCPWPRFQAAMVDEHSLIVTYETWRGEPRGPAKAAPGATGRGDCVDCTLCVQVCPTGTDIRQGSQLSCIGCGLCIDACQPVMDRLKRPRGLIAYDSIARQLARSRGETVSVPLVRGRTLIYAGLLVAVMAVMGTSLALRGTFGMTIEHERSPLYVALSDGSIRNGYTVKVLNKEREARPFLLALTGTPGGTLTVVGQPAAPVGATPTDPAGPGLPGPAAAALQVRGDTVTTFRVYVTVPRVTVPRLARASDISPTATGGTPAFALTNTGTGRLISQSITIARPES